MWPCKSSNNGFTLIELLIVLVILGLTLALVSPTIMRSYEKQQIKLERAQLTSILSYAAKRAPEWRGVNVLIEGKTLNLSSPMGIGNKQGKQFEFSFLHFNRVEFSYNPNGYTLQKSITLHSGESVDIPRSII